MDSITFEEKMKILNIEAREKDIETKKKKNACGNCKHRNIHTCDSCSNHVSSFI